jgi:hypothetical protein
MAQKNIKLIIIFFVLFVNYLCGQQACAINNSDFFSDTIIVKNVANSFFERRHKFNLKIDAPAPITEEHCFCDSMCIETIADLTDIIQLTIINSYERDTLYLLDSYLLDDLMYSKYLHRYDKKGLCKLSFLPIIPYLSVKKTDAVLVRDNRVVNKNQVLYHFISIPPKSYVRIIMHKDVFDTEYIKDFDVHKYTKFDDIKIKNVSKFDCHKRIIEFAIYTNIDFISGDMFYYKETQFNIEAQLFRILSIEIK